MIEFYPQIKLVHLTTVLLSGGLFLLRGALLLAGKPQWAIAVPLRYASYATDTALLTAALMLLSILPTAFFANGWLVTKLAFLAPYIVFASLALRRATTARTRIMAYLLALASYGIMLSIAHAHHPLGLLRP